ncbi:hypothetical protein [Weissella hellenica]
MTKLTASERYLNCSDFCNLNHDVTKFNPMDKTGKIITNKTINGGKKWH